MGFISNPPPSVAVTLSSNTTQGLDATNNSVLNFGSVASHYYGFIKFGNTPPAGPQLLFTDTQNTSSVELRVSGTATGFYAYSAGEYTARYGPDRIEHTNNFLGQRLFIGENVSDYIIRVADRVGNSVSMLSAATATATAGAGVLPAAPVGFLVFHRNGAPIRVPYYNP